MLTLLVSWLLIQPFLGELPQWTDLAGPLKRGGHSAQLQKKSKRGALFLYGGWWLGKGGTAVRGMWTPGSELSLMWD